MSDMEAPLTRVHAVSKGPGPQYITDGDGDQNVALAEGVVLKVGNIFNLHGEVGMSSLWQLANFFAGQKNAPRVASHVDIVDWLKRQPDQTPLDPRAHHLDLLGQVVKETGQWVLESDAFLAWKDASSASRFLWMHGILGSGKTMLVSLIIDLLEREIQELGDVACVYFYFQEGEEHCIPLARVWTTLLTQLLGRQSGALASDLKAKFNSSLQGSTRPSSADYLALFQAQAGSFKTVYLVIDALDICQDAPSEKTQQGMQDALKGFPDNVRVLFTCRYERFGLSIGESQKLSIRPRKQDVKQYVKKRIEDDGTLSCVLESARDQAFVINEVTNMTLSSGMFLLARLHMDNLTKTKLGTLNDVKMAVKKLPDGAHTMFDNSAQKLKDARDTFDGRIATHILTWVTHAKEELNVEQIRDSFAVQKSKGQPFREYRPATTLLLPACNGLVVMNSDKGTLSLVHKSAQECLERHNIIPKNADLEVAKACLLYLLADANEQEGEPPLLQYAAKYWSAHLCHKEQGVDPETEALVLSFLSDSGKLARAFGALAGTDSGVFEHMTGLHAVVHFSLADWAERLLNSHTKVDVNAQCAAGQTALHWAVRYGRLKLLELLIRKSADPSISDDAGNTPLHKALEGPAADGEKPLHLAIMRSAADDVGIVQALMKGKAPLGALNKKGISPLHSAIRYGPTAIAMIMIEGQDDVNAEVEDDYTSLRLVFYHGRDIVQKLENGGAAAASGPEGWARVRNAARNHSRLLTNLLLARGVDLNRPSRRDGWTPLMYAAMYGEMSKLYQLVTREPDPADVNLRDRQGKSPLWWAVGYNRAAAAQLLVDHGADVNETYADGSTPLIEAVKLGHHKCVWLLLNAGALHDTRDRSGWTALLHAVDKKDKRTTWLLLAMGAKVANPNESGSGGDGHGPNALEMAVDHDDLQTAWLLSEHGASLGAVDDKGMTPLHRAAKRGRLGAVRFLLDRAAAVNAKDNRGLTPLHHAALQEQDGVVATLAAGLQAPQLDTPDDEGNTALMLATLTRRLANMRALLSRGASCNVADPLGRTAVHLAANLGFHEGLRLLVDSGGSVNVADKEMITPLHHVVNGGTDDKAAHALDVLVKAGAGLEARDEYGRTPMILAVQLGRETLVKGLLEAGADPLAVDDRGKTAAFYAEAHSSIERHLEKWTKPRERRPVAPGYY